MSLIQMKSSVTIITKKQYKLWKKLKPEHTRFLLGLRKERPDQPKYYYVALLNKVYRVRVCEKTITIFFVNNPEFMFNGNFVTPNKVPIDKFVDKNILKVYEYQEIMGQLQDYVERFNFIDKKHIVIKH